MGETARRVITVGEDAIESFQSSDFEQIINTTKFVVAAANRRLHTSINQINAEERGEGRKRTCDRRGTQGERYLIIMGTVELGGGRKYY